MGLIRGCMLGCITICCCMGALIPIPMPLVCMPGDCLRGAVVPGCIIGTMPCCMPMPPGCIPGDCLIGAGALPGGLRGAVLSACIPGCMPIYCYMPGFYLRGFVRPERRFIGTPCCYCYCIEEPILIPMPPGRMTGDCRIGGLIEEVSTITIPG